MNAAGRKRWGNELFRSTSGGGEGKVRSDVWRRTEAEYQRDILATEGLRLILNLHGKTEVKRNVITASVCSCVSPSFLDKKNIGVLQSYQSCFILKCFVSPGFTALFWIQTSDHNKYDGSSSVLIILVGEILYLLGCITLFLLSCQFFFFFFVLSEFPGGCQGTTVYCFWKTKKKKNKLIWRSHGKYLGHVWHFSKLSVNLNCSINTVLMPHMCLSNILAKHYALLSTLTNRLQLSAWIQDSKFSGTLPDVAHRAVLNVFNSILKL